MEFNSRELKKHRVYSSWSEHFTMVWNQNNIDLIESIILTASGGPFIITNKKLN